MKLFETPGSNRQLEIMKTHFCIASDISTRFVALTACILFTLSMGAFAQAGNEMIGEDGVVIEPTLPCPTLEVEDIRELGIDHHTLKVRFPWFLAVDIESLGDGDILVTGPNGYEQRASFESVDFELGFSEIPDNLITLPPPEPKLTSTYRISPPVNPDGTSTTWMPEHNGTYAVSLLAEQVMSREGTFLPPKLLGGFHVAIRAGEPVTIQPVETRIHISNRPAGEDVELSEPNANGVVVDYDPNSYWATVELFFDCPNIEVEFAELVRDGNSFVANVKALKLPLPDPLPVPILDANASGLVEGDSDRPLVLTIRVQTYLLGLLEPGAYGFLLNVNEEPEGDKEFLVSEEPGDINPPEAALRVRNITQAYDGPQRIEVVFEDPSGVDISTIGDGDIKVYSPCLLLGDSLLLPFPCEWEIQRARLVEVLASSDNPNRVVAVYEIDSPEGGWTHEHNGFFPVVWCGEAVCDRLGNCNREMRIGGFEVAIEPNNEPPFQAEVEIRVDASNPDNVVAKVHIQFLEHAMVVGQDVFRDGNRIFLLAKAEHLAVPAISPPPSQDLIFEIGPLREGMYAAIFEMNEFKYSVTEFKVHRDPEPPISANVEVFVDASDPQNVIAEVKVQFRTPHAVSQGEVEVGTHRVFLPAKAEPLPILTNDLSFATQPLAAGEDEIIDLPLPEPIFLRYEIGELPPGGYLAIFQMNEFPYGAEDFRIEEPGPPIPAEVSLEIDTEDPDNVVAFVKVFFESPHQIVEREIHRMDGKFILETIVRPILPPEGDAGVTIADILFANPVVIEFPLGALEPGEYGAVFVMNGFPYEDARFEIDEDPSFGAEVSLAVEQNDFGIWYAIAKVWFSDPGVRIVDQGDVQYEGQRLKINAKAEITDTDDVPERPFVLEYDLGNNFLPGPYHLAYCINDRRAADIEFFVEPEPPIPAEVEIEVEVDESAAVALVHIQFRDHFEIVGRDVSHEGNMFCIDLKVEGPLPILAPVPPPPITLEIPLADNLENGRYLAIVKMNEFPYARNAFQIHHDPFEVEVDLKVDVGDSIIANAVVDFVDPYILITDAGEPEIDGNLITINATAKEVVFITEPSGDPQTFEYNLGELGAGPYRLLFLINGVTKAHTGFIVREGQGEPLPHIAGIEIEEGDALWFATTKVILLPGQALTDCGVVRQSENEFHVNITVDWVDFPDPIPVPIDVESLPDGVLLSENGEVVIGGFPVRIEECSHVLGVLEPGEYKFIVHSRGESIARKHFVVPGSGPEAKLKAENITEQNDDPYRFAINYSDPDGLDHDSIRSTEVFVFGRDGMGSTADLVEYANTENIPSTGATAVYAIRPPDGEWDQSDNGKYCIAVDTEAVRDLLGNTLMNGELGCFNVRIFNEPPGPPDAEIKVDIGLSEEGIWFADVEIIPAGGVHFVVDDWGSVNHHGQTFIALATVGRSDFATSVVPEPLAHRYRLGELGPGFYVFVFKTNLAHCALEDFVVPGLPGDPIDTWRKMIGVVNVDERSDDDGDRINLLGEYFFALDPKRPDVPRIIPEIVEDSAGKKHLAVRFRRLLNADGVREVILVSRDLKTWFRANGTQTEVVEEELVFDGTEEILICLTEELSEDSFSFMRVDVEREE